MENNIISFKDRVIDLDKPVKLYRNLTKKGVWYSLVQGNKTVAHTSSICLKSCMFVVNETTRQRILKTKRKEFHAYILGYVTQCTSTDDFRGPVRYNPFISGDFTWGWVKVNRAKTVICDNEGVKAKCLN